MSIIFENVTKTIRGKTVLQGVTLSMEAGRVTGLRGINGSGKTMLLRLLAGLIHPTEGRITIDGKTLGTDMEFPPSMGLLIENPAFLGQYTGAENLEMLASLHQNVTKEDVRALLEKVGLAADGDTKYRKYSLGMKQRLGIAGAILGEPKLPTPWTRKAWNCSAASFKRNGGGEPPSWWPVTMQFSWNPSAMKSTAWKMDS